MDVRERIRKIIEQEQLTQAEFCRITGINTSTLSHVLTGRNNPTIELLTKIFEAYPKYNPSWVLHGQGEMLVLDPQVLSQTPRVDETKDSYSVKSCGDEVEGDYPLFSRRNTNEVPAPEKSEYPNIAPQPQSERQSSTTSSCLPTHQGQQPTPTRKQRAITKVIVFYDDSTFDTFVPEP